MREDVDLDAWEAPPPPAGLADAVIACARDGVPALEPEPPRRRWWLAGVAGVLVAGAAVGALVALGGKHAAPAHGNVDAQRAQRLELDTVSAELDSGAFVRWDRTSDALAVAQSRGNATWRVGDDHLRIDAGNGITVDASGASLRVEVHMLNTDARVLGASTLTAAAVAFVTVVVYEGHVKVNSASQTVNVEPGATVQVAPGQPPGPPPPVVAGDDRVQKLTEQVESLQAQLDALHPAGGPVPAPPPAPAPPPTFDQQPAGKGLDRTTISEGVTAVKAKIMACGDAHPANGLVKLHVRVLPEGKVAEVTVTLTPDAALGACVAGEMQHAIFAKTDVGGTFSYPFRFEHAKTAACDADALDQKARDAEAMGQHAAALSAMEKAIACKPSPQRYQLAFMSSCNAGNLDKARTYYPLSGPIGKSIAQMCVRNGITIDMLEAASGYAHVSSKPSAEIFVDGKDTGLVTPITGQQLPLTPGKHKITFLVGGVDRYTYPVNVRSGETVELSKDLQ